MDAYTGEIRIFAGNFAPKDWAFCNGQILPIAQNTALFSIIGTTYGGDGKTTFALPNLSGRAPMHQGAGPGLTQHGIGEWGGEASVTLKPEEIPAHGHTPLSKTGRQKVSNSTSPQGSVWAAGEQLYNSSNVTLPMSHSSIQQTGGNMPHNNMQPHLGVNYIICLKGEFPPRS